MFPGKRLTIDCVLKPGGELFEPGGDSFSFSTAGAALVGTQFRLARYDAMLLLPTRV